MVTTDFLPAGETIDLDYYCGVLRRLKEDIRWKRPDLWQMLDTGYHKFFLHHDNAPCHTSAMTLGLIGTSHIDMVPHPPYSPDLAPCDFFKFFIPQTQGRTPGTSAPELE